VWEGAERESFPEWPDPYQKNRLGSSLWYVDKLLRGVEQIIAEPSSKSPFRGYLADVSPEQQAVIERSIGEIRQALVEVLAHHQIPMPEAKVSALHAIRTHLDYVDIAIAELAPRHMKGYGGIEEAAARQLDRIVHQLGALVRRLHRYLGGTLLQD